MTAPLAAPLMVSVVIVSRGRPEALRRCLLGLSQLIYRPFEVIVVADPASCAHLRGWPQATRARVIAFDKANISAARNLGIGAAAGEIVAFVDDDAVPEPTWLSYLVAPFADPAVMAAGGWVRGRNGISWQSQSQTVDDRGRAVPLEVHPERATVLTARPGQAIKTEGTNMALRRSVLIRLGGFDARYRFFLDETDLNLRLAALGAKTALVPRAEVHHGYAASARRRADRVPTDLTEIGASWAVFLACHCPEEARAARWGEVQAEERSRALRHMVRGGLEPRDVRRLMRTLVAGFAEGQKRVAAPEALQPDAAEFVPFASGTAPEPVVIAGRGWRCRRLLERGRRAAEAGHRVSLFCFSRTALYHRVRFTDDGIWLQSGGLFGRSERTQKLFAGWRFKRRLLAETRRVKVAREL